ncbi:MAG: STAS/SEC14 domain-containing protein [Candidatus Sumerlaeia bacterium]
MIEFTKLHEGRILQLTLTGKLSREDYKHFLPEIEQLIETHGKISILMFMVDFHGWTAGGLVEDTQFAVRHARHIDRIAMVGDKKWEHGMAVVCKPFTSAEIRFFEPSQAADARAWVEHGAKAEAA